LEPPELVYGLFQAVLGCAHEVNAAEHCVDAFGPSQFLASADGVDNALHFVPTKVSKLSTI
jgi:hypothetical protein